MPRRNLSSSSIDYALLSFLISRPMHGYEMHQMLQKLPGLSRVWTLKQALLYAKLEKLENSGLIAPYPTMEHNFTPPRKYFQITESGKTTLETWFHETVIKSRDMRQEFLAKLLLIRQFRPHLLPELLDRQIDLTEAWVSSLESELANESEKLLEDWLITSFRLLQVQSMLDWLQKVKSRLI